MRNRTHERKKVPVEIKISPSEVKTEMVKFVDLGGSEMKQKDAVNRILESLDMYAAELAAEIGQSKRTVQNWRSGGRMGVAAALVLKNWLERGEVAK